MFLHDWTFPEARGVFAVVHGYAEHGGRYEHFGRACRRHGLATMAQDLRGHGRSPGRRGHIRRFTDYHEDVRSLLHETRKRCPGIPVFLLGHSMGGLVVLDLLGSNTDVGVAGVVLSSPLLGLAKEVPALTRWFVGLVNRVWPGRKFATGLDGSTVCRDADLRRFYDEDPFVFRHTTARWFIEADRAIARVHHATLAEPPPILLLAAGNDRVASLAATQRFAQNHGLANQLEVFAGYNHELLNEAPEFREPIIDRIARWAIALIEKQAPGDGSS